MIPDPQQIGDDGGDGPPIPGKSGMAVGTRMDPRGDGGRDGDRGFRASALVHRNAQQLETDFRNTVAVMIPANDAQACAAAFARPIDSELTPLPSLPALHSSALRLLGDCPHCCLLCL